MTVEPGGRLVEFAVRALDAELSEQTSSRGFVERVEPVPDARALVVFEAGQGFHIDPAR